MRNINPNSMVKAERRNGKFQPQRNLVGGGGLEETAQEEDR